MGGLITKYWEFTESIFESAADKHPQTGRYLPLTYSQLERVNQSPDYPVRWRSIPVLYCLDADKDGVISLGDLQAFFMFAIENVPTDVAGSRFESKLIAACVRHAASALQSDHDEAPVSANFMAMWLMRVLRGSASPTEDEERITTLLRFYAPSVPVGSSVTAGGSCGAVKALRRRNPGVLELSTPVDDSESDDPDSNGYVSEFLCECRGYLGRGTLPALCAILGIDPAMHSPDVLAARLVAVAVDANRQRQPCRCQPSFFPAEKLSGKAILAKLEAIRPPASAMRKLADRGVSLEEFCAPDAVAASFARVVPVDVVHDFLREYVQAYLSLSLCVVSAEKEKKSQDALSSKANFSSTLAPQ